MDISRDMHRIGVKPSLIYKPYYLDYTIEVCLGGERKDKARHNNEVIRDFCRFFDFEIPKARKELLFNVNYRRYFNNLDAVLWFVKRYAPEKEDWIKELKIQIEEAEKAAQLSTVAKFICNSR